jgi:glutamate--cysteine ligase
MAHTPHPFSQEERYIVRDFCENQTEINTPVTAGPHEAVVALRDYDRLIRRTLQALPEQEYLWPFSNPPYLRNEEDVPVAQFQGAQASKTVYRNYLSDRYGRYKMTFSGIHFNYSFDEALLRADFALSGETDFGAYRDRLYVELAEKAAAYGWIITAVTAASPLMDSSYVEKGSHGGALFHGMASVRCSELGYWNDFTPILDYTDVSHYADSIQRYVDQGMIRYPSELYYPIRLKPPGENNLDNLRQQGVNHIELRMLDLNPLAPGGIEEKDVHFAQLLLVWLASLPRLHLTAKDQVEVIRNFKNAAHYDLKTAKITLLPTGESLPGVEAAQRVLGQMADFYADAPAAVHQTLDFQQAKFQDAELRYAWRIRKGYDGDFVGKGLALAKAQSLT